MIIIIKHKENHYRHSIFFSNIWKNGTITKKEINK